MEDLPGDTLQFLLSSRYCEIGWHTFDARHNERRIGRILIARGRDAADVAISTAFGTTWLTEFSVITEEADNSPLSIAAE